MAKIQGKLVEIYETGAGTGLKIGLEHTLNFLPGQYFHCVDKAGHEFLPNILYPLEIERQILSVFPLRSENGWVGQELTLRGPLGNGFHLPANAERIGLIGFGKAQVLPLLPLARSLLAAGKEVTLVSDARLQGLPMALELLPAEQRKEVVAWADALALCVHRSEVSALLANIENRSSRKTVEVLIQSEMPCGGVSLCGVCAVQTRKGWQHPCKDGPVFSLSELVAE
jgi:2-polyprenylphenol hydroxylase and related flavodoxin oxidoreductases